MDDFVVILDNVEDLKKIKLEVDVYLKEKLQLKLKKEATYLNKVDNGISFCGVRIFKNMIRIKKESLRLSVSKIKLRLIS